MPDETKITGKACEQDDRGDGKDGGKGAEGDGEELELGEKKYYHGRTNK